MYFQLSVPWNLLSPVLVRQYAALVSLSKLTSIAEAERKKVMEDPTELSHIDAEHEVCVNYLLHCSDAKGLAHVDEEALAKFKDMYGSTLPYFCRYEDCAQAIEGFSSLESRKQHEIQHARRLQCDVPNCPWNDAGFRKPRDLRNHKQKYHSMPMPDLPNLPTGDEVANADEPSKLTQVKLQKRSNLNFAGLSIEELPEDKKEGGDDWWVMYNPELKRTSSILLMHTKQHEHTVYSVAISKDMEYIATGSEGVARVFRMTDGSLLSEIDVCSSGVDGIERRVDAVYVMPRGEMLITGDSACQIKV